MLDAERAYIVADRPNCFCRAGSAIRLSRDEVDYARPEDPEAQSKRPIDTEEVIVGSVVKQESGRLTVMFPRDVAELDHAQQLWR